MALKYSGVQAVLRSVELKDLPPEALAVSPNKTVPSLVVSEHRFIDESWDIMQWAIQQHDPDNWLGDNDCYLQRTRELVYTNDFSFKKNLDLYKYAVRFPQHPMEFYRNSCETFLQQLNTLLEANRYLLSTNISVADVAVFPFIRQFAMVDRQWFDLSPYTRLQNWLGLMLANDFYKAAFKKQPVYQSGQKDILL